MPSDDDGWNEWCKHVLAELERLNTCYESLDKKFDNHLQHTESRLTSIETTLKNQKWAFGIIFTALVSIIITIVCLIFG